MDPAWIVDGPSSASHSFAFAHGAGAPMDSPFMQQVAEGLAERGVRVVRFEFPYMAQRRTTGKKRGPDRAAVLEQTWRDVIEALGAPTSLFIGGKSMGGRIATMVADEAGVAGVVCLGYPFHPPGKPERTRIDHLRTLRTPCLIVQGTRDALGTKEEVSGYGLPDGIALEWLEDGNHSFEPRKKSGYSHAEHLQTAVRVVADFIERS